MNAAWFGILVGAALSAAPGVKPPLCSRGMAFIRGGAYRLGQRGDEVAVADFCLDRTEVTVRAYDACVQKKACTKASASVEWPGISERSRTEWSASCNAGRAGRRDHPVNCVDWGQADAFCRAAGKRLPSEEEWEWAARGGERGNAFPWGAAPAEEQVCWNKRPNGSVDGRRSGTCKVGSHPSGDSPDGVQDLGGNVWEWTSSRNRGGNDRVSRGGGWYYNSPLVVGAEYRGWNWPGQRGSDLGFRCAAPPPDRKSHR